MPLLSAIRVRARLFATSTHRTKFQTRENTSQVATPIAVDLAFKMAKIVVILYQNEHLILLQHQF